MLCLQPVTTDFRFLGRLSFPGVLLGGGFLGELGEVGDLFVGDQFVDDVGETRLVVHGSGHDVVNDLAHVALVLQVRRHQILSFFSRS